MMGQVDDLGDSSVQGYRINGGTLNTGGVQRAVPDLKMAIGGNAGFSGDFNGIVGEVIVITSLLNDADRQKLEGYLAHKWGLASNLPEGHDYKADPPAGFTPADVTPAAWYDASDRSTISASVSQWNDKSGSNYHVAQATDADKPITGTRMIGGLNALDYQAGADRLNGGASVGMQYITLFAVYDLDTIATGGYVTYLVKSSGDFDSIRFVEDGGTMKIGSRTGPAGLKSVTVGTSTTPRFLSYVANGYSYREAWLDGTSLGTNTTTLALGTANLIYAGQGLDGLIGEVIYVNSVLSTSDRQRIEGYLAHKWGLAANLPDEHPFKSMPPGGSGEAIANQPPTGIGESAATFNAALNVSGTNYDITVHYGTTDGGTNAGVWGASEYAGSWTNVSTNVSYAASGLVGGTTYYYTFMASNAAGVTWASPSWTFTTPGSVPAVTENYAVPHTWLASQNPAWADDFEAAVLDDPDGDGFSTWQEYWSGTDPQNSNSYLKIDSVIFDGTNIVIVWSNAVVGAGLPPLGIQARGDLLSGTWSNAGQKSLANGVNAWSNSAAQQLYYRLAVTNAP
jgi:hypothetical protein